MKTSSRPSRRLPFRTTRPSVSPTAATAAARPTHSTASPARPSTRSSTPPATSALSSPSLPLPPPPVCQPVLQPWHLRLVHRHLQVLQGLRQRQLRQPEHARHVNCLRLVYYFAAP